MAAHRQHLPSEPAARRRILLRLLPLLLFFLATVGWGLIHGVLQSLAIVGPPALSGTGPGFHAYRALLQRRDLISSLIHTLYVALVSASVAVALGALLAYLLWLAPRRVRAAAAVYRLPIILPHIVVAFITALLWSQSGIVASVLMRLGIDLGAEGFPVLLYADNGVGMIVAYIYKEFPFVALLALGVLDRVPRRMVTTARMLGAGELRIFFRVVLPQLAPMLNQVFIIMFLYALGGFDIPWLLGASNPQMLPMTVYSLYFQGSLADRAIAMAALTLLALVALVFVMLYSRLARRLSVWERPL